MTIYICGDSTAQTYTADKAPQHGWGQLLPDLLPGVTVCNHAMAGRSTKSFLAEGRLDAVEPLLREGDLLLIQFAHNDWNEKPERHTEPYGDYVDNLTRFVDTARRHGATPVLLTSIPMRLWENGELCESHGEYVPAMRALAERLNVPLIDVYAAGTAHLRTLGEEASLALHLPGDNAHTCREGAEVYARIIAEGLQALHLTEERTE